MRSGDVLDDRFRIEAVAGSGGMGTVYRAFDLERARAVAVKTMHAAMQRERFAREVELLRTVRHPGIVEHVHDGTTPEGLPYLAMEWLEGEDLASRLERGALSGEDATKVALRAAEALGALHRHGIVHRDVKPANLFLVAGDADRIKLLDLGVARLEQPHTALTGTGLAIGTPDYMAPEQARGQRDLDPRADVFALGCVIFECLAGRRPFAADHAVAVLAKILLEEAPRVSALRPDAPRCLDLLVARTLSKDRRLRPADGLAVARIVSEGDAPPVSEPHDEARGLGTTEQRVIPVILTRGASETEATLSPEQQRELTQAVVDEVARYEGTLERLANGSLLVTFAARGIATDRAGLAARCALALAAILGDDQVVLATGRGVVGGAQPFGEVIDRAAALLADARSGSGISVDDVTVSLLEKDFEIADGRLHAQRQDRGPRRRLLGRPTTCVGRERELALLETTVAECIAEPVARAVLITAPAGMGKSLLARELIDRAEAAHPALCTLRGEADPASPGSAFGIASGLVQAAADIGPSDSLDARREKLAARMEACGLRGDDARSVLEMLGEIVGAAVPDSEASTVLRAARADPALMSDAIGRGWERWLAAECERAPVLLVLEDLHWGDLPTVKLVDGALRNLEERPLLVLATARPDVHETFEDLWRERGVFEVRLGPLTRRAAERLVETFVGDAVTREVIDEVVARASGHPFFLEELIRAVAEGCSAGDLPDTILGMLQSRFDVLGGDAKRVLRAASVFGRTFTADGVRSLLGESAAPESISEQLDLLGERELIEPAADGDVPTFGFRHALVRDAAYATLTEEDRRVGHRLAGEWLEKTGARDALALAEHHARGGDPRRALPWYRQAAEQAFEGGDPGSAVARAQQAIDCGAELEERAELELLMAEAHYYGGALEEAEAVAERAAAGFDAGSAPWFEAMANASVSAGQRGQNDRVEAILARVRATTAFENAIPEQVVALCRSVSQLVYAHRFDVALRAAAQAEDLFALVPSPGPFVEGWMRRVRGEVAAFGRGELQPYLDELDAARLCFERAGADRYACLVSLLRGGVYSYLGAVDEVPEDTRRGLERARTLGSEYLWAFGRLQLSHHALFAGDLAQARALLEEHEDRLGAGGRLGFAVQLFTAYVDHAEGRLERAMARTERALSMCEARTLRAQALGMMALLRTQSGRPEEALPIAREAVSLSEMPGYDAVQNLAEHGLAETLLALGDEAGAREALSIALDRIHRIAATLADPRMRETYVERRFYHREIVTRARELGALRR